MQLLQISYHVNFLNELFLFEYIILYWSQLIINDHEYNDYYSILTMWTVSSLILNIFSKSTNSWWNSCTFSQPILITLKYEISADIF